MLFICHFSNCCVSDEYKVLEFVEYKICKELLIMVFNWCLYNRNVPLILADVQILEVKGYFYKKCIMCP